MTERYPVIRMHQFGSDSPTDELVLFAAPATALVQWAGIPRKGWRVRMLYQRWVTPGRGREVKAFWDEAGRNGANGKFLVGPTALTLAATQPLDINDAGIALSYEPVFAPADSEEVQLQKAAAAAFDVIAPRLSHAEIEEAERLAATEPYSAAPYETNHILQSAVQIRQMSADPGGFVGENQIESEERAELVTALEAICRPALVVDGQHRLLGAALSEFPIQLPVILVPHATWVDQIYQFVVINETSRRVQSDLLTDIFGNSLTPEEQGTVRSWLSNTNIQVESRIAAVIAGNNPDSPFRGLVKLRLGDGQLAASGFITEKTIRQLIDGGRGNTPGWRTDSEFFRHYVSPRIPDRDEWESWSTGRWQEYWFAFWSELANFYNAQSHPPGSLWKDEQTNLTKAVSLRLMQELFIRHVVETAKSADRAIDQLRSMLGGRISEEELAVMIKDEVEKVTLPSTVAEFRRVVREDFLSNGVPVRVFEKSWVASLDDAQGISELRLELDKAFSLTRANERYKAQNKAVFAVEDGS